MCVASGKPGGLRKRPTGRGYNWIVSEPGRAEVEWQFDTEDPRAVVAVLDAGEFGDFDVCPGPAFELRDLYFDTADLRLGRAGFAARLRHRDGRLQLGLKTRAEAEGGLRRRREFEEYDPPAELAAISQAPGPAGHLLRLAGEGDGYRELFTLQTTRRTYSVAEGGLVRAEIAVDTTVRRGSGGVASTVLYRVEVEAAGEAEVNAASRFVACLLGRVALSPATVSKFEFGLAGIGDGAPERAGDRNRPGPETSADSVARGIVGAQLGALLEHEPGARVGLVPEPLHDFRVAARRMRAALALFKRQLPPELSVYRSEAKWVGTATGRLRDLDVQLAGLERDGSRLAVPAEILHLFRSRRARARRTMLRALSSPRFGRFVGALGAALEGAEPVAAGLRPLAEIAPRLLGRRYASMQRRGRRLVVESPAEDFHDLRIAVKKLRYALEFFGSVYGRELKKYRSRLVSLQDLLGEHQDADVGAAMLREMACREGARLGLEGRRFLESAAVAREHEAGLLRARFSKRWDRLSGDAWRRVLGARER